LPWIFFANIITLLVSSWALNKARHCYLKDKTPDYERYLGVTVLLSLVFLAGQVIGWITLFNNNVQLQSSPLAAYLYVLSFIHLLHVVAGLPFLVIFWLAARQRMKEEVSVAVYFSDPDKRLKLRLLMMYWHFLDILWIYLVVFLLINYII
jgi:cytochrome c oxidase subunit 3